MELVKVLSCIRGYLWFWAPTHWISEQTDQQQRVMSLKNKQLNELRVKCLSPRPERTCNQFICPDWEDLHQSDPWYHSCICYPVELSKYKHRFYDERQCFLTCFQHMENATITREHGGFTRKHCACIKVWLKWVKGVSTQWLNYINSHIERITGTWRICKCLGVNIS
jgi:hypothetical protein